MHEVSIAQSIIEAVRRESADHGILCVTNVHIAVGALAGVSIDSLRFAWDLVTEETIAAGSRLTVREIPARACCRPCNHYFETAGFFALALAAANRLEISSRAGNWN